jgi:stress-induced morphogen
VHAPCLHRHRFCPLAQPKVTIRNSALPSQITSTLTLTGHAAGSVEVISEQFAGKTMVARHRLVYATLDGEMVDGGIHALALKTKTPAELAKAAPAN